MYLVQQQRLLRIAQLLVLKVPGSGSYQLVVGCSIADQCLSWLLCDVIERSASSPFVKLQLGVAIV